MELNSSLGMAESLVEVAASLRGGMTVLALCTLRMYVAFFVAPITDDQLISGPLRNGMCIVLGSFIAFGQPTTLLENHSIGMLAALMLKEALIGTLLGFSMAIVTWVSQGVGAMIDNSAGFNNVQQTHPMTGEQSTPVSNLLGQLVVAGFYMLGGMTVCMGLIFQSYQWWPLTDLTPTLGAGLIDFLTTEVDTYFTAVVKISSPVMMVMILIDLGFGLIAKTADKLEPNNLGGPIKAATAIVLVALLVSLFFEQNKPEVSMLNLQKDLTRWVGGKKLGEE